jgi:hypothetical protein
MPEGVPVEVVNIACAQSGLEENRALEWWD